MTDKEAAGVPSPGGTSRRVVTKLYVHQGRDVAIVMPHGMLLGGGETSAFEKELARCLDSGTKAVIIDFAATYHLDSSTIGILQSANRRAVQRGIALLLCNVNDRILRSLAIVQLAKSLRIFDTCAACLESIERSETGLREPGHS
jgi:anti-anti-sigma factor